MKYSSIIRIIGTIMFSGLIMYAEDPPKPEVTKPSPIAVTSARLDDASRSGGDVKDDTDLIAYMLKTKGLTRETARIDPQILEPLYNQNRMVMSHFLKYWKNPYEFPKFAISLLKFQEESVVTDTAMFDIFGMGQARTGHRSATRFDYVPEMKVDKDNPISEAVNALAKQCKTELTEAAKDNLAAAINKVPTEVQSQIAKMLLAAKEGKLYRDRALRNYPKEKWINAFDCAVRSFSGEDSNLPDESEDGGIVNWDLGQALDYDDLYSGAGVCLREIINMERSLADWSKALTETGKIKLDLSGIAFEFNTPLGKVAFNAKNEDNTYQGEDYLLIIDLGGNDTYKGAAAASYKLDHPVSVIIDQSGNDIYVADKSTPCAQGAGILGYGFLVDNGGNDTFTAVNNAQGMCYFGVGVLCDRGGDDSFKSRVSSQGSAAFGVASLIKTGGNDSYYAYYTSQGFGFVGGYGCLIDTDGNDKYVAEPYDLIHPGKGGHDNLRNYSFCQGAGWGQRGDLFGGHAMGGGIGILQDLGGDDHYECGVYGQATGYWYGTGILHDKSGNDNYEGSFFVQSGTAHMGMTMLLDNAGNDNYHIWHAISMAGAHDVSVSWLIDKAGDDNFAAWEWKDEKGQQSIQETITKSDGAPSGTTIGSAITNSFAMFVNIGGNDTYEVYTKDSLGFCHQRGEPGSWRYDLFNIGMFIDVGGEDAYNMIIEKDTPRNNRNTAVTATANSAAAAPADGQMPKNNSSWVRVLYPGNPDKTFSLGLDVEKGKVLEVGD